ncbi:PH domain-containing protein [Mycolicibacterium hippocampi]|uniref:Low molecular weight protein antigen 6 n=1 Tax=Mycolicibacterium hippocampi TaxID=659824 RepID=A0A850Q2S6_9MYCO|nr:PH domain-containing protein [Mycolicibacterium hippocampi]NVN53946.1 Low molecular weight protein antigen 6 [Mycolicibacterium hippocampi]
MGSPSTSAPVVIRISPMAHLAVALFSFALLSVVLAVGGWSVLLFVIPVMLSLVISRYRTTADGDGVTARRLLSSETVRWDEIDGLRFGRRAWALARRRDGSELPLPAVTFATLPQLTVASGGRVPNPYD